MFSKDFVFGAATASYQIEGAAKEDGRVPSIWDTFSAVKGNVANGDTGEVACDHYHRYREDVQLLGELGVDAYRFSFAWPRIVSEPGKINQKGLDFYDRLIDELLSKKIAPYATLYHWDMPQWAFDKGGWLQRDAGKYFLEYVSVVFDAFKDRIKPWVTLNEPFVVAALGYLLGQHAPGHKSMQDYVQVMHHLLLWHGEAVKLMRSAASSDHNFGIVINCSYTTPETENEKDKEAAHSADTFLNRSYFEPVFLGKYPAELEEMASHSQLDLSHIKDGDLGVISTPLDFVGINYYSPTCVRYSETAPGNHEFVKRPELKVTAMNWEVEPESMYKMVAQIRERYTKLPLFITENGAAFDDTVSEDGSVHDKERLDYYKGHLAQVKRMVDDGLDVKGYFAWSLLDNFEWAYGYDKRFGLVRVDYATQKRTLKDSAYFYSRIVKGEESL